ncbi:uncharacterized protein [Clytia hemisphaerica]|uniref:uncharacterized protein isoform X2 n=1 Tax=Clytia hemisphaerica TaxID=252671 RepID=UPI0034D47ACC
MQRQHYVIALLIGWIYLATVTAIDGDCWQGVDCVTCGGWQGGIYGVPVCCAYCEKSGMALRPTSCDCLHNGDDKPKISGNSTIIDNEQLELKCNSIWGRSFTSYKWFRNGMVINGATNEMYQTINFKREGASHYFCQVSNGILTKTSDIVTVTALYLEKPKVVGKTEVEMYGLLILYCESHGVPAINSYEWFRNGKTLGNGLSVRLIVNTIYAGSFSCEVSNGIFKKLSDPVPVTVLSTHLYKAGKLYVNWSEPVHTNGDVRKYELCHKLLNGDEGMNTNEHCHELDGKVTAMTIIGLRPFSAYQITMQAFYEEGLSQKAAINASTYEGVPWNVQNLSVNEPTSTSFEVEWDPPENIFGIFQGYTVEHSLANSESLEVGCQDIIQRSCKIDGLKPYTEYDVQVTVRNQAFKNTTVETFRTKTAVPSNVQNLRVNKSTSTSFELEWDPPENIFGILQGYTVEYSLANSESLEVGCQNTFQRRCKIDGLKPYTEYDVQVTVRNQAFKNTTVETFRTRTAAPPPFQGSLWDIENVTSNSFTIKLVQFDETNGPIEQYIVIARKLERGVSPTIHPSIYTNEDISKAKDGLFVAKIITERDTFGQFVVIRSINASQIRTKRDLTLDEFTLEANTYYTVFIRGITEDGHFQSTLWYTPLFLPEEDETAHKAGVNLALIIGGSVGIVVFITLCFVAFYWFYFRTRRRKDKEMKNEEQEEEGSEIYDEGSMIYNELPEEGSEIYAVLPELSVDDHEKPAHHDPDDKPPPLPPRDRNSSTMTSSIKDRGQEPVTAQDETSNSDVYVYRTPDDNDILPNAKINPHKDKKLNSESDVYFYRTPIDENDILPKAKINPDNSIDFQQNEDVSINTPED